jgi:hypothetical protein
VDYRFAKPVKPAKKAKCIKITMPELPRNFAGKTDPEHPYFISFTAPETSYIWQNELR